MYIEGERLVIKETGGFASDDLFVRASNGRIQVEGGRFSGFNKWTSENVKGWLQPGPNSLKVIDDKGNAMKADFAAN